MPGVQEVYMETNCNLPPAERLRLATLILHHLTGSEVAIVETSDFWTEQDQSDLTDFSLAYANIIYAEDLDGTS